MRIYLPTTCAGPEGTFTGDNEYEVPGQMPMPLARRLVEDTAAHWVGPGPDDRQEQVEAAVESPAPENAAERTLPPWTLKTDPADYLDQYGDDAPNSELARRHLEG